MIIYVLFSDYNFSLSFPESAFWTIDFPAVISLKSTDLSIELSF